MFTESDVPVIAKRIAKWDEVYFGALAYLAGEYRHPESVLPYHLRTHPRRTELVVTPTGCVARTYAAETPSCSSEWNTTPLPQLLTLAFFLGDNTPSPRDHEMIQTINRMLAHPKFEFVMFRHWPEDEGVSRLQEHGSWWETVRVFTDIRANSWGDDSARDEAQRDVSFVTARRLLGVDLSSQAPPEDAAAARDEVTAALEALVSQFESLLGNASREEELQAFLDSHPLLLDIRAVAVDAKVRLGSDYVTDFIISLAGSRHVLVEIERATHPLFTQGNNPSAALAHAVQQVEDWLEWSYEHLGYLRATYPTMHEPKGLVIIGRRSGLNPKSIRALRRRNAVHAVRVLTYDDLADEVRAVMRNLVDMKRRRRS